MLFLNSKYRQDVEGQWCYMVRIMTAMVNRVKITPAMLDDFSMIGWLLLCQPDHRSACLIIIKIARLLLCQPNYRYAGPTIATLGWPLLPKLPEHPWNGLKIIKIHCLNYRYRLIAQQMGKKGIVSGRVALDQCFKIWTRHRYGKEKESMVKGLNRDWTRILPVFELLITTWLICKPYYVM